MPGPSDRERRLLLLGVYLPQDRPNHPVDYRHSAKSFRSAPVRAERRLSSCAVNIGNLTRQPLLQVGMSRIDSALISSVEASDPVLSQVAAHLISAGGKRLRPAVAMAAALASANEISDDVISAACVMELIHLGSLYHDDVLDRATTRRTVPSVNAKYGDFMAIIAGDYLLARASAIAAKLGGEIPMIAAQTIGSLCEGQVWEQRFAYDLNRTVDAYYSSIAGKTASLISASARVGALSAGATTEQVQALAQFAYRFGMAFQIRDDILDLTGTDESLGKPAGNDMAEGVYTLPVILAAQDSQVKSQLSQLLGKNSSQESRSEARALILECGALSEAVDIAQQWSDEAKAFLGALPESQVNEMLRELASDLCRDLPLARPTSVTDTPVTLGATSKLG